MFNASREKSKVKEGLSETMRQIPTSLRLRLISIKFNSQTGMNRELQWPDPKVLSYWNLFKLYFRYFV